MSTMNPYRFEPNPMPFTLPPESRLVTGDASIDGLNLVRIKAKAVSEESGLEWSSEDANAIGELYRAFLFLCKTYPNEVIVPPREVDELWHLHILDTRNYLADCQRIFGGYLHHFPYAGLEGTAAIGEEKVYVERTVSLIANHFPQLLEEIA